MASFISLLSGIVVDERGEYDGDVDEVLSRNLTQSSKVIGSGGVRVTIVDDVDDLDELELASSSMLSMNNRRGTIGVGVVVCV